MEASVKEKNIPTISSNLYGGLQKWVTRASLSIRERKKSRRNSDVSQPTMFKSSLPPETQGYQDNSQHGIAPVHVRSRSVPVEMLEPEDLTFVERNYRKSSWGPILTQRNSYQKESLLEPWRRQESAKDDTNNLKEARTAIRPKTLSRGFSKSESSLLEASLNSTHSVRSKFQTTPPKDRVRRTSSQTTEESLERCTSDLDINCNIDKKTNNSAQALKKANKTDEALKFSDKLRKSSSTNKLAKDIKYRLDKWVEKTTGFHDSRQSSFESTSSSDEPSDTLLFRKENKSVTSNETRQLRELQNALEDLVSSCGRNSRKSSEQRQRDTGPTTNNVQAIRKVSLKNAGAVFSKGVGSDSPCSQSVLQNEYRSKRCGSSSSTGSRASITDETIKENNNNNKTNSQLEVSFNSYHGKRAREKGVRDEEERYDLNILNCDIDIESGSTDTRATFTSMEILESDLSNQNNFVTPPKCLNNDENECQQKNPPTQYYDQEDNCLSSNETKQTETNEQVSKQSPVGAMDDTNEVENHTNTPTKSTKSYHAPPPPSGTSNGSRSQGKRYSDGTFNDVDLDAFAEECLRQAADKKKSKERAESKSDSEEEKRSLKVNFIYIKDEAKLKKSIANNYGQPQKTPTDHKSCFDESFLHDNTFSDNECEGNAPLSKSKIREKRSSVDSHDGMVLLPQHEDTKNAQSAEEDFSSDSFQNEDDLTTENPGTGMRKFPSMPLFYVPKEFDHNMDFKQNKTSSLRKSLWKRIKSLPQKSENRVNKNLKSKKKGEDTSPPQFIDPFYHGDKEEDDLTPAMRTKSWTLSTTKINRTTVPKRRPSLETRQSTPAMKVVNFEQNQEPDRLLNDYVVIPPKESRC